MDGSTSESCPKAGLVIGGLLPVLTYLFELEAAKFVTR